MTTSTNGGGLAKHKFFSSRVCRLVLIIAYSFGREKSLSTNNNNEKLGMGGVYRGEKKK